MPFYVGGVKAASIGESGLYSYNGLTITGRQVFGFLPAPATVTAGGFAPTPATR
jgi:hypothetical protein